MCCCEAERFCFRFSLSQGAIAAACISVLICAAAIALGVLIHIFPEEMLKYKHWILEDSSDFVHDLNKVYVIGYAVLGSGVMSGFAAVFLIMGIITKNDMLVLPWLGIWMIFFLFFLIILTVQSSLSIYVILPVSFVIGLHLYLWITVHSFYNTLPAISAMKNKKKQKKLIFNGSMKA